MKSLRQLIVYMRPYYISAIMAAVLMALEVSMDLTQPRLLQRIIDVGVANKDLNYVLHTGLYMLGVALLGTIGGIGCTVFSTLAALNFSADIRADLFKKIQSLSFGNLDRLETGGLITRLTNDVERVQDTAMMFLRILIRAPLLAIGGLLMAIITAPRLSVILFIVGPLIIFMLRIVNKKAKPMFTAVQESLDKVNTVVQENLAGVRIVKAFVRADHEIKRFENANEQLRAQTVFAMSLVAIIMPVMLFLLNSGIVAALWFGGIEVHHGTLQIGHLLAFFNYLTQMLSSLMILGMILTWVARADASAERILEALHSTPDVVDLPDAKDLESINGRITFDNVGFSYDGPGGTEVLSDIDFDVSPGRTVGILGSTGSGKSTLIHLIPRLYDVTRGCVLIDGIDVRQVTQDSLRKHIAMVLQDTVLFSGTIRENLLYGRPNATEEELIEAAKMAQAYDFIKEMPDGFDSMLGQGGVNLSGGQKQRLSIARALVARPSILLLDDCTSSVDMATEAAIIKALNNWEHRCTRVVVAQRISSVIEADMIILLDDGKICAIGTHNELLRTSPEYQDIVRSQSGALEVLDAR